MKVIFVFAHPDDESFSSGGTIRKFYEEGHIVKLITATRGEAGELGHPPITTRERIGKTRESELKKATEILGIKEIFFLDYIDGTLNEVDYGEITQKILKIFETEEPDIIFTFDKNGGSNHPDHIKIHKVTKRAFDKYIKSVDKNIKLYNTATPKSHLKVLYKKKVGYSAFGKMKGVKDSEITTIIDINETFDLKVKALKMHKTQNKDWERYLKRENLIDLKKEHFILIQEKNLV